MKRYTRVVKVGKKLFRYDREDCVVQWVSKATAEMRKDNEEWMEKWGRPLWDIGDDGYEVVDSIGLSRKNWDNVEARKEYLQMWNDELNEEAAYLAEEFKMYG